MAIATVMKLNANVAKLLIAQSNMIPEHGSNTKNTASESGTGTL